MKRCFQWIRRSPQTSVTGPVGGCGASQGAQLLRSPRRVRSAIRGVRQIRQGMGHLTATDGHRQSSLLQDTQKTHQNTSDHVTFRRSSRPVTYLSVSKNSWDLLSISKIIDLQLRSHGRGVQENHTTEAKGSKDVNCHRVVPHQSYTLFRRRPVIGMCICIQLDGMP